jgi:hypothetical protein
MVYGATRMVNRLLKRLGEIQGILLGLKALLELFKEYEELVDSNTRLYDRHEMMKIRP